jgi:hypothetical protein
MLLHNNNDFNSERSNLIWTVSFNVHLCRCLWNSMILLRSLPWIISSQCVKTKILRSQRRKRSDLLDGVGHSLHLHPLVLAPAQESRLIARKQSLNILQNIYLCPTKLCFRLHRTYLCWTTLPNTWRFRKSWLLQVQFSGLEQRNRSTLLHAIRRSVELQAIMISTAESKIQRLCRTTRVLGLIP